METTDVHFSLEIPLEPEEPEIRQEDEIPDPISLGANIVVGTAKIVSKVLGGIYDGIKPESTNSEKEEENLE